VRGASSLATAREIRWAGQGLASRSWQASDTLRYLRASPHQAIITNDLPAIYFHLGQNAFALPSETNPALAIRREDYDS
jgi:hypothetical protein